MYRGFYFCLVVFCEMSITKCLQHNLSLTTEKVLSCQFLTRKHYSRHCYRKNVLNWLVQMILTNVNVENGQ